MVLTTFHRAWTAQRLDPTAIFLSCHATLWNLVRTMVYANWRMLYLADTSASVRQVTMEWTVNWIISRVHLALVGMVANVECFLTISTTAPASGVGEDVGANTEWTTVTMSRAKMRASVVRCFVVTTVNVWPVAMRVRIVRSPRAESTFWKLWRKPSPTSPLSPFVRWHSSWSSWIYSGTGSISVRNRNPSHWNRSQSNECVLECNASSMCPNRAQPSIFPKTELTDFDWIFHRLTSGLIYFFILSHCSHVNKETLGSFSMYKKQTYNCFVLLFLGK